MPRTEPEVQPQERSLVLTIDDAPSIRTGSAAADSGATMDAILGMLQRADVEHCVAFVVGSWVAGHEASLQRWLGAGFQLGNHTHSHWRCSERGRDHFLADVVACDEVLEAVGAFEAGRPRYFRFPFLDRGRVDDRGWIAEQIAAAGYCVVHGSIDWFDYHYDACLEDVSGVPDPGVIAAIEDRYVASALAATSHEFRRSRRRLGRDVRHIAYCHFGVATARCLPRILRGLTDVGVRFAPVVEAIGEPLYAEFEAQPLANGRVPQALFRRRFDDSVRRLLAAWSVGAGLFGQTKIGPRWPWRLE